MQIEERISLGNVIVRVFHPGNPAPLVKRIGRMGFGITRLDGKGYFASPVAVLYMVDPSAHLRELLSPRH